MTLFSRYGELTIGNERILVVDDEIDVRALMVIVLESAGFEVSELESAHNLMDKVLEWKPSVIVLDVTMPQVDGLTVLKQLKEDSSTRHIPVLMASAQGQKSTLLRAKELGATDFMVKPWGDGEFEWRVQECLKRSGNQEAA